MGYGADVDEVYPQWPPWPNWVAGFSPWWIASSRGHDAMLITIPRRFGERHAMGVSGEVSSPLIISLRFLSITGQFVIAYTTNTCICSCIRKRTQEYACVRMGMTMCVCTNLRILQEYACALANYACAVRAYRALKHIGRCSSRQTWIFPLRIRSSIAMAVRRLYHGLQGDWREPFFGQGSLQERNARTHVGQPVHPARQLLTAQQLQRRNTPVHTSNQNAVPA